MLLKTGLRRSLEMRFKTQKENERQERLLLSVLPSFVAQQVTRFGLANAHQTGLPDGLFSNQKSQFGKILDGLAMENLVIFCDHLVYFTAIGNILWLFGIFGGTLVYFSPFWYFGP
jgi:hypothetical protein